MNCFIRNTIARYDNTMATNKKEFMFKKPQEVWNYKQWWNRDMTFALQDAKLWDHIMGSVRRQPELKKTKEDDADRKESIYQYFDLDVWKTSAKISRICTDTI